MKLAAYKALTDNGNTILLEKAEGALQEITYFGAADRVPYINVIRTLAALRESEVFLAENTSKDYGYRAELLCRNKRVKSIDEGELLDFLKVEFEDFQNLRLIPKGVKAYMTAALS